MVKTGVDALWRTAYRRVVRSAFATVPFYRERWALGGRTEPRLGSGSAEGAVSTEDLVRAAVDLAPLAGGPTGFDPVRGLGGLLPLARPTAGDGLLVALEHPGARPVWDLPRGWRGCLVDAEVDDPALPEVGAALGAGRPVVAVGPDKALDGFTDRLPGGDRVHRVPRRALDRLDNGPYGVLHDPVLGYLGVLRDCGLWHLDWTRVYARRTRAGLAFTLLRQRSPRLVDALVGGGVPGRVEWCPRHGTPVVRTVAG